MNYENERIVELAAGMTKVLVAVHSETTKSLTLTKPSDLRFYGAIVYGLCAAVLVCFSKTSLVWPLLAPCALGMIMGGGLVAADQFSLRLRLEQLRRYLGN